MQCVANKAQYATFRNLTKGNHFYGRPSIYDPAMTRELLEKLITA
jgi:hypothetical protein